MLQRGYLKVGRLEFWNGHFSLKTISKIKDWLSKFSKQVMTRSSSKRNKRFLRLVITCDFSRQDDY